MSSAEPIRPNAETERWVSVDLLRGFTLFWILGADAVVQAWARWWPHPWAQALARQTEHVEWAGFRFYDLIFPLFLFITGVSMAFSLGRGQPGERMRKLAVRALILFGLGVLYNGGLSSPWEEVRWVGVLQRIALASLAAGALWLYAPPRLRAGVAVALLLGYWALLAWVPIRDVTLQREALAARLGSDTLSADTVHSLFQQTTTTVQGKYEPGLNLAHHLDYLYLPGGKYDGYWDPEGLLSTLPAVVTCLLGLAAGAWLGRQDRTVSQKAAGLAGAGLVCLAIGWGWSPVLPVIEKLWTPSFVLVAGGWSLLLLAATVTCAEGWRWRGGVLSPWLWLGMNPITLYLATSLIDFYGIAARFVGGSVGTFLDRSLGAGAAALTLAAGALLLLISVAGFLYRRRLFLKV